MNSGRKWLLSSRSIELNTRWVVERTYSWMNRYRRVLTRWEKKVENYEAMLHFVCGIIVWNKILLG
ncbi:transposase, partial [Escherichia coli]|nr:transposase [Escherichia coli]